MPQNASVGVCGVAGGQIVGRGGHDNPFARLVVPEPCKASSASVVKNVDHSVFQQCVGLAAGLDVCKDVWQDHQVAAVAAVTGS